MGIPPIDLNEEEEGLINDFEMFTDECNKHRRKFEKEFYKLTLHSLSSLETKRN